MITPELIKERVASLAHDNNWPKGAGIRITHVPTGMRIEYNGERTTLANYEKVMLTFPYDILAESGWRDFQVDTFRSY